MIDALERRAGRGVVVGADETWRVAHDQDRVAPAEPATTGAGYRLVLAACVVLLVGFVTWTATSGGRGTDVGTIAPAAEVPSALPHAPVVVEGMRMIEAYETSGSAEAVGTEGASTWEVYVHPDGVAAGVAMVATTASDGLAIRSAGLDGRALVEAARFVGGAWVLGENVGLDGPVDRFSLPSAGADSTSHHYTFVDPAAPPFHEASIAVSSGPLWTPLHAMLSGDRPPVIEAIRVLDGDGLAVEIADGMSVVLWSDGDHTYVAQSPAHPVGPGEEAPAALRPGQLAERVVLTDADTWRAAVDDAAVNPVFDGDEGLVFTLLIGVLGLAFGLLLIGTLVLGGRWWRRRIDPT